MCDIDGILTTERAESGDLNAYNNKDSPATFPEGGIAEAIAGADVFVGLSVGRRHRQSGDGPIDGRRPDHLRDG